MDNVLKISEVTDQIQKFWGPIVYDKLQTHTHLAGLVSKDYTGEIKAKGDTVQVTQIQKATGQTKTIGTDADTFESEKLNKRKIDIKIAKRFVVGYEFDDLVEIFSQIQMSDSPIRQSMETAIREQIDAYLKTFIAPSASSPDHITNGVADFNQAAIIAVRKLIGAAKWTMDKPWYGLVDSSYYGDILGATTLTSSDYVAEKPVINAQINQPRFGINFLEDNSKTVDTGLIFHPDFLHYVSRPPKFQISDLHPLGRFGYKMSLDVLGGAASGFDSDLLHITVDAT